MARNRSKSTCRFCGDVSATCPVTWKATGVCAACAAPAVNAERRGRNAERRGDRETVVTVERVREPEPLRCIQTYRGEVWINSAGEPV
jgi:hypothetical protein